MSRGSGTTPEHAMHCDSDSVQIRTEAKGCRMGKHGPKKEKESYYPVNSRT